MDKSTVSCFLLTLIHLSNIIRFPPSTVTVFSLYSVLYDLILILYCITRFQGQHFVYSIWYLVMHCILTSFHSIKLYINYIILYYISFCRQKQFLPVKLILVRIFFHFFSLHNIFLITCYLFNCWHRIQSFFSNVMLKELPRLKLTTNSTTRPRLHPCRCHLSRPTSDAEPE